MVEVTIPHQGRKEGSNITYQIIHNETNSYLLNAVSHHLPDIHQNLSEKVFKADITKEKMMEALIEGNQIWQKEIGDGESNKQCEPRPQKQATKVKEKLSTPQLTNLEP